MNRIRLGLFGAEDSVEIMISVMANYPKFTTIPVTYWQDDEIREKISAHDELVDMWLFSGPIPYKFAMKWYDTTKPLFYVPSSGSSLYKTLLQISFHHQIPFNQLSYDTFHPDELKQVAEELEVTLEPLCVHSYEGEIYKDEVVRHHYELWKKGEIKAAVTCLKNAQHDLLALGVPAFRVLPSHSAIISTLSLISQTQETIHFKDSQIAVQMIEFDSFYSLTKDSFSTDEIHKVEIKMTEKLLDYAKKINGSLKSAGPGRYVIFTTRGILQEATHDFTRVPDFEGLDAMTSGIGIGQTVYEAEINSGTALLHAKEHGNGSLMIVFDDKTISGPLGMPEQITYDFTSSHLQAIGEKTALSVTTLSKLESILKKMGTQEINAHELAQQMKILPRSARRILTDLEINGLAEVVAEANIHPRGRPRKVYKITIS